MSQDNHLETDLFVGGPEHGNKKAVLYGRRCLVNEYPTLPPIGFTANQAPQAKVHTYFLEQKGDSCYSMRFWRHEDVKDEDLINELCSAIVKNHNTQA